MAKLRALQELHSSNRPDTAPCNGQNGHNGHNNDHDTNVSRSKKLKFLNERLNEQASLEEHVSDRTRKILESMRRDRLSNRGLGTSRQNSGSSSRRASISRQSSFLIEKQEGVGDIGHSISHIVWDQELPTVEKYLKQSFPERRFLNCADSKTVQTSTPRPRHKKSRYLVSVSQSQLETINGSGSDNIGSPIVVTAAPPRSESNPNHPVSPESGYEDANFLESATVSPCLDNMGGSMDLQLARSGALATFMENSADELNSDSSSGSSSLS